MRYYSGTSFDGQGRIVLTGFVQANSEVVIYRENSDRLVYIEQYDGDESIPKSAIRSVDSKSRVCLPKWARRGATGCLIGSDRKRVVLRMMFDSE